MTNLELFQASKLRMQVEFYASKTLRIHYFMQHDE